MPAGWIGRSRPDLDRLQGDVGRWTASRQTLRQSGEVDRRPHGDRALLAGVWQRRPRPQRGLCLTRPPRGRAAERQAVRNMLWIGNPDWTMNASPCLMEFIAPDGRQGA